MFISGIKKYKYFVISICILIFTLVYYMFSHHVYSMYLTLSFIPSLVIGIISLLRKGRMIEKNILSSLDLALSSYLILNGILVIAGTSSNLVTVLLVMSIILLLGYVLTIVLNLKRTTD